MSEELVALFARREMGRVRRKQQGRLSFVYDEHWRQSTGMVLSLSMPLAATEHGHRPINAFLWGLLPDNEHVLSRWAARFHVSARDPFALVSNVGEDCAGAVQFVRADRIDEWLEQTDDPIDWLDEQLVADRLRLLKADPSAWRTPRDTGQFSLAGAQPKTALLFDGRRWGVPSGHTPTTHILKPPASAFDGHAENEHFCLNLARRLGLPVATSMVMEFADEKAIVVERYDRRRSDGNILRVHQEDICQALAVSPTGKYQNGGGPGPREVIELLGHSSSRSDEDIATFIDALIFNWIIVGTDAHAKNYSLLLGTSGQVRLAPLYDLASALPYDEMDFKSLRLAMKIGRHYRVRDIRIRDWKHLARDCRLNQEMVIHRLEHVSQQIPDEATTVRKDCRSDGLGHRILDVLLRTFTDRAQECARLIRTAAAVGK